MGKGAEREPETEGERESDARAELEGDRAGKRDSVAQPVGEGEPPGEGEGVLRKRFRVNDISWGVSEVTRRIDRLRKHHPALRRLASARHILFANQDNELGNFRRFLGNKILVPVAP